VKKHGWLALIVLIALLVAACGPEMATPTPQDTPSEAETEAPTAPTAPASAQETPPEMPVASDDWHVLGSPDAAVTIVEYSDFQ